MEREPNLSVMYEPKLTYFETTATVRTKCHKCHAYVESGQRYKVNLNDGRTFHVVCTRKQGDNSAKRAVRNGPPKFPSGRSRSFTQKKGGRSGPVKRITAGGDNPMEVQDSGIFNRITRKLI